MEIKPGMEVYINDEMMKLNSFFLKKNGPFKVMGIDSDKYGTEMAYLISDDPDNVTIQDIGIMMFPTSTLYTKEEMLEGKVKESKSYKELNIPDSFMQKPKVKKYYYRTLKNKVVVSEQKLYEDEVITIENKTSKIYDTDIIDYEFENTQYIDHNRIYNFVMSMDELAIDKALSAKSYNINSYEKDLIKDVLNIKTLNDLNKYEFITRNEIKTKLMDILVNATGQYILKIQEIKTILDAMIDSVAEQKGYSKIPKLDWVYYKEKENK